MAETLKQVRQFSGYTQKQAAELINVPLRTYKRYENDEEKVGTMKYDFILSALKEKTLIDETHGVLTIEQIKSTVSEVLEEYDADYVILFGSYAKGRETPRSDVDLVISTETTGLRFYGLVERLRVALHKKVDLLNIRQLDNNPELMREVLKDGIRIYDKK